MKIRLHVGVEGLNFRQRKIVQGRELSRNSVMSPQIGTVRHGLVVDFKQDVVHVQRVRKRSSGRHLERGQIQNLRFLRGGEQVAQSDFIRSADHAVGGDAAKLGILDHDRLSFTMPADHRAGTGNRHAHPFRQVDSAADDCLKLSVPDIHAAHSQLVRIGMGLDFFNYAYNHVVEAAGKILHILHLHGGHGQVVRQLLQIYILRNFHIIPDPR